LLIQVRQRQAQRQTTVLGRRRSGALAWPSPTRLALRRVVHHQPRIDGRLAPHRPTRRDATPARWCRVEIDLQHFRRPGVKAVLTDDLLRSLRIAANPGLCAALGSPVRRNTRVSSRLRGAITLFRRLAADRLAHLIEAFDGFGMTRQADQGQTAHKQEFTKTHGRFLSTRAAGTDRVNRSSKAVTIAIAKHSHGPVSFRTVITIDG
jgi:hypothetical protein